MPTQNTGGGQTRPSRRAEEHEDVEESTQSGSDVRERHEKLSDDIDSLLDEIDETLEENSEEFVKGFVQKGGQ